MYAAASARLAIAKNSVAEKSRQLQTAASSHAAHAEHLLARAQRAFTLLSIYTYAPSSLMAV
jgi:hypothetical protein